MTYWKNSFVLHKWDDQVRISQKHGLPLCLTNPTFVGPCGQPSDTQACRPRNYTCSSKISLERFVFTKFTLSSDLPLSTAAGLLSSALGGSSWEIIHTMLKLSSWEHETSVTLSPDFQFLSCPRHRGRSLRLAGQALSRRLLLNHREKPNHVLPGGFVSQYGEEGTANATELHRDQARGIWRTGVETHR